MKRLLPTIALVLSLLGGHALAETLTFTTYYYNDHLGNPVAATDERGDLLWRAHFTPYGERHENPANNAFGTVGYTGHAQDKASGLVYMGARYYDPVIGRFMAVDPVGFQDQNPQSFGRYLYANNNPLRFVDPDGRMSDEALLSGSWVPGFEGNIYQGDGGLGPIGGVRRGVTQQGELVNGPVVREAGARAKEIHSVLDARAQRTRTTAVTETQEGVRVVSSSERRLTPAQRAQLGANEVEGVGAGHAEVTGVNAARQMGLTPTGTAASRPICPSCAGTLREQGIEPLSPLK